MEKEVCFKNSSKEKLIGYLHNPKKKTSKGIILAHCFTCSRHAKVMRKLCDYLAENGFLILRFDFSGNGESEGKFEEATYSKEIKDMHSAIEYMCTKKGITSLGALGHSMGSAITILSSCKEKKIKSLCTLSGASNTASIVSVFDTKTLDKIYKEGKAKVKIFGKTAIMTKKFFEDAETHDIQASLSKLTRPYCIIHGDKDTIIPVINAKRLYKYTKGKRKEIHIIKDCDHMFSKKKNLEEMKNIVLKWFRRTLNNSSKIHSN
jgi:uncharacterized protein